MTDALTRARADLAAGCAWRARDRLSGLLVHRQDDEVLELLAQVHLGMGELPKAGALLYVLRRGDPRDEVERSALEAWRRRYGDAGARWHSIPASVRSARSAEIDLLRADGVDGIRDLPAPGDASDDPDGLWGPAGCLLVLVLLAALVVVGAVTVVRWLF